MTAVFKGLHIREGPGQKWGEFNPVTSHLCKSKWYDLQSEIGSFGSLSFYKDENLSDDHGLW